MAIPAFSGYVDDDKIIIELKMLKKHLKLVFDRTKCVGCGICLAICLVGAVEREPIGASRKGLTNVPSVLIDQKKCSFCGICEILCPFGCSELTIDGEHKLIIQENEALPKIEKIEVDCEETGNKACKFFEGEIRIHPENCPGGCSTCVQICPVGALYIPKKQSWEKSVKIEVECVNSCPAKDVIEIKRENIKFQGEHTEIWKEIIEKLKKTKKNIKY